MAQPKFKTRQTKTTEKARVNAFLDGRSTNANYTSGARTVGDFRDDKGYRMSEQAGMQRAWENRQTVQTYTSSARGRMSTNGRTAGGSTWTFTQKDDDGNKIRQSGRSKIATRRQRYYDIRVGLGLAGG